MRDVFKVIERDWRQRVETVPDSTRIEEYRRRARELERGGNVLQRLGDLDALRKDVRADLKALSGLEDQLKQDLATVDSQQDRKSTRLNSSHVAISYAVFCLKKERAILEYRKQRD